MFDNYNFAIVNFCMPLRGLQSFLLCKVSLRMLQRKVVFEAYRVQKSFCCCVAGFVLLECFSSTYLAVSFYGICLRLHFILFISILGILLYWFSFSM